MSKKNKTLMMTEWETCFRIKLVRMMKINLKLMETPKYYQTNYREGDINRRFIKDQGQGRLINI